MPIWVDLLFDLGGGEQFGEMSRVSAIRFGRCHGLVSSDLGGGEQFGPRFRTITPNRLRLNNFYAISGLLRQTTKYDDKRPWTRGKQDYCVVYEVYLNVPDIFGFCFILIVVHFYSNNPRFRTITPNRLRLNNFYAISGLLRQTTKYDDKVEFFIEACSFELLSVRTILTQPQGSRNVTRTAPPDDFENFIHKKFHSEQSLKCQRTNYDGIAKNLQEISSPDVQFLKPAVSAPTVPTPPIKFTITAINTGSIQNITLNKFQEGEAQKLNSPIHSMSGIKDPINEEK
ncbi:hypothetical protein Glove_232g32 [Diversispora epigaea]|uniref:Uncharacterized protein n=1 Tax=Diversispora epigaea TaxID=1348612 RepID=A0A397IEP4_9GLOM|nr:hypothetical protein Glove_232g32 [Diversispora epigaea]